MFLFYKDFRTVIAKKKYLNGHNLIFVPYLYQKYHFRKNICILSTFSQFTELNQSFWILSETTKKGRVIIIATTHQFSFSR